MPDQFSAVLEIIVALLALQVARFFRRTKEPTPEILALRRCFVFTAAYFITGSIYHLLPIVSLRLQVALALQWVHVAFDVVLAATFLSLFRALDA